MKTMLLFLSLLVVLEARLVSGMPGSLFDISQDDRGLQEAVLAATYSFNNQSNDAFLFKPSAIHRAQKQIVRGVRYLVDVDISRTVCRKGNNDFSQCDFQPEGQLQQTFHCHSDVWVLPWKNEVRILDFPCES
ncbi:cystatin-F [Solea senegalensis]|uniref:Cystatin-F n=2 Tax=Solea senegalensis TaxID=28829 RepID=A0AAV6PJJ5_SOLSE|nr:cystatin-F [Solea senegalensis]